MPRACLPSTFRPSDVIRISANGKGRAGKRVVVVERENFDPNVKVLWRGIVKNASGERISDTVEGFTSLSARVLYPVEGVWEGELTPGAPGRTVEYNNRAYVTPKPLKRQKGETAMAATKSKGGRKTTAAKKTAAKKSTAAPRATEAQLDRDAARVVKMRDQQNKSWGDIEEATGIAPSRLRQLYTRGGGQSSGTRGKGAASGGRKTAAKKGAAKGAAKATTGRGKGKRRNPS
jgi:hypothetical protein